jgi:hypothetical protein
MGPFRKTVNHVSGIKHATSSRPVGDLRGSLACGSTVIAALTPLGEQGTGQPLYAALDAGPARPRANRCTA